MTHTPAEKWFLAAFLVAIVAGLILDTVRPMNPQSQPTPCICK